MSEPQQPIGWPARIRRVVEAARGFVRTADEFPPEEGGEGCPWAAGTELEMLASAIDACVIEEQAPYVLLCRGCYQPAPSEFFDDLKTAGWFVTPPNISEANGGPDLYCPECRTLLREAVSR